MNWNLKKYIKLRGVQILALGFVVIILVGTILLTLPISTASGESTSCTFYSNFCSMCNRINSS